jgi:hypothetical protein
MKEYMESQEVGRTYTYLYKSHLSPSQWITVASDNEAVTVAGRDKRILDGVDVTELREIVHYHTATRQIPDKVKYYVFYATQECLGDGGFVVRCSIDEEDLEETLEQYKYTGYRCSEILEKNEEF